MAKLQDFTNGIVDDNPVIVQMIGLCPLLAVSTSLWNALGMGVAVIFVLVFSNMIISAVRKVVPDNIRIPIFLIIISTFVTIVDYIMAAYLPALSVTLGVFIPLIVVNCIILARAEAFAYKNAVLPSILDGLGMGIGFLLVISLIGFIREFFGDGRIAGRLIWTDPAILMILPPGGFITVGAIIVAVRLIRGKQGS